VLTTFLFSLFIFECWLNGLIPASRDGNSAVVKGLLHNGANVDDRERERISFSVLLLCPSFQLHQLRLNQGPHQFEVHHGGSKIHQMWSSMTEK
jgi:hypothetical protein